MGASSCAARSTCCSGSKLGGLDMPEYEPQRKGEAQRECIEPAPPMSFTAHQDRYAPAESSQAKSRCEIEAVVQEPSQESYFARELEELRALPCGSSSVGPRPAYTFRTGATYRGQWQANTRHGLGEQTWVDGAQFIGNWAKNFAEGLGQFLHADGDVFVGQWQKNAAQGFGHYYHKKGLTTYGGTWVDDLQDGDGVEEWDGGSKYHGQFVQGKKEGHGVYTWPDGSSYAGQWRANSINGYGHYIGLDGREFKGMWREAVIHGCGKYSWPDGRTFCGQYSDDSKHGFGIFTWKDGRRFEGFWHQGKQHGYGVTYTPTGEIVKRGFWVHGQQPDASEGAPETKREIINPVEKKPTVLCRAVHDGSADVTIGTVAMIT
mmetsp:Transcript_78977/g.205295  ORF Transcript_78977/g.205295 Transcript_78977/m.205295 type:complete len:376 (+) Transcript_78977:51-1178(+)